MVFSPTLLLALLGGVSAAGNMVTLEVVGTTWCPCCTQHIGTARDMLQKYGGLKKVNYTYYPANDCKKGAVSIQCADDAVALEGCLKQYLNNKAEDYLQAFPCCQGGSQTLVQAIDCIKKLPIARKLNMDKLKKCGAGIEGRNYLAAAAEDYNRALKGLAYYPWGKIDGQTPQQGLWIYRPWQEVCKLLSPKPRECP